MNSLKFAPEYKAIFLFQSQHTIYSSSIFPGTIRISIFSRIS